MSLSFYHLPIDILSLIWTLVLHLLALIYDLSSTLNNFYILFYLFCYKQAQNYLLFIPSFPYSLWPLNDSYKWFSKGNTHQNQVIIKNVDLFAEVLTAGLGCSIFRMCRPFDYNAGSLPEHTFGNFLLEWIC